jgi:heat shock protein HslJ
MNILFEGLQLKNLLMLVTLALLFSCQSNNSAEDNPDEILLGQWELSVLDGSKVITDRPIHIEFGKENLVSGFVGCNTLTGSYSIDGENQITFENLATTKMACPQKEMDIESSLLSFLESVDSYSVEDGKLNLNVDESKATALFYQMSESDVVNKYWKLIKLEGQPIEMVENQEREQYFTLRSDGSITGFAGCNYFNGSYTLEDGNRIRVDENLAMTMKLCPDVDVNEIKYLEVFKLADNYTISNDTLSLNVGRRAPLAVFEAIYF